MSLSEEQLYAFNILTSGVNCFVTGGGGTGKSFIINEFIKQSKDKSKNIIVTAPTGIAALNIDGATIHRTFRAPLHPIIEDVEKPINEIIEADIIIIDEISMCRADLFTFISKHIGLANKVRIKIHKKTIQLIVVGDFFQLPPVLTDADREFLEGYYGCPIGKAFAFQSPYWKKYNFVNILLKEVVRQSDKEFIHNLNGIRTGDRRSLYYFEYKAKKDKISDAITICGTNKKAKQINDEEMSKIDKPFHSYEAEIEGEVKDSDKATDDVLMLKVGCRVMTLINDTDSGEYNNGTLGTVIKLTDNRIFVKLDNKRTVGIEKYTWEIKEYTLESGVVQQKTIGTFIQFPVKVAYAVTIHKSQGQTYDKMNFEPLCWESGQLYVALSRVKSIENLCINGVLRQNYLQTSSDVKAFYNNIEKEV